jgi:uncharacterized membrane protein
LISINISQNSTDQVIDISEGAALSAWHINWEQLSAQTISAMNIKQIFGILLTVLGIAALIYTGVQVMDSGKDQFKVLIVTGILGIVFFSSGVKLIQAIKE